MLLQSNSYQVFDLTASITQRFINVGTLKYSYLDQVCFATQILEYQDRRILPGSWSTCQKSTTILESAILETGIIRS